jgi:hypothetical protein
MENRKLKKTAFVFLVIVIAVLGLFAAQTVSVQAESFPDTISLPDGWFPEGIATGRGTDFYVGSLIDGSIYKGDLSSGAGEVLVGGEAGTIAVGLSHDARSNYLFVAGGGPALDPALLPAIRVFDGATGTQLAEYFVNGGFINDVIVTREAAYFTDSFLAQYYVVPLSAAGGLPDASQIQTVPLSGDFIQVDGFNSNGIEATPDGRWLLLVNATTGLLYRVDPQSGVAQDIDLGGALLDGGDGILLEGKTLYVVRQGAITVVELSPDFLSGTLVDTITIPNPVSPTTVAGFGNSLYTVDAKFPFLGDPTVPFEVQRLSK